MLDLFDELSFNDVELDRIFKLGGIIPKNIEKEKSEERTYKAIGSSFISIQHEKETERIDYSNKGSYVDFASKIIRGFQVM